MLLSPTACRECGARSTLGGYCSAHQQPFARRFRRVHDDVDKMYGRSRWLVFRKWMLAHNPICQRLDKNREQCNAPARVVHHLNSPRVRPDLFIDPKNVVCVCFNCHPSDEGTMWWRAGVEYVATEWRNPIVG
jgi:hypothetical protein